MQYYCGNASQTLFCDGVSGSLGDVPGGEAKALLQIILGADFAVLILYCHISHGGRLPNGEYLGNGGEQTVHVVVVFAGYHCAALLRILNHQRLIQRLDGEHIDHRGLDALFCQSGGGSQRLGDHDAAGDDGHVRALAQHDALADFKFFALGVYRGAGLAAHAQIFHAGNIRQLGRHILQHCAVGHIDDGGRRHDAIQRHILKGHVGAAVEGGAHAGIAADHGNVVVGIATGEEDLVKTATGGKGAEGMNHRLEPCRRQSGRDTRHVGTGLVQRPERLPGNESLCRQRRILRRTGMPLGKYELATILPLGVRRIQPENFAVQRCQRVRHAQRAADMAKPARLDLFHDTDPDLQRQAFSICLFIATS